MELVRQMFGTFFSRVEATLCLGNRSTHDSLPRCMAEVSEDTSTASFIGKKEGQTACIWLGKSLRVRMNFVCAGHQRTGRLKVFVHQFSDGGSHPPPFLVLGGGRAGSRVSVSNWLTTLVP